ncbi:MAG: hypothetical protein IPK07_29270 [Deltaproteobacteria bacterium]|nr:hypothetical protein [Deltaproteobacteria bacterium]
MTRRRRAFGLALAGFVVATSLVSDLPVTRRRVFQSDEATYYVMAQSLAHDLDLTYTRHDLARSHQEFPGGPQGVFLKKVAGDRIVFGKGYLLPLLAAPFVRVLDARGFLVLHAVLLAACIAAGASWLRAMGGARGAAATAATFVAGSVLPVYARWMTTEISHFALVFLGMALWFRPPFRPAPLDGPWARRFGTDPRDVAATVLFGLATFLKPLPNVLLAVPLGLSCLWRRRWWGTVVVGAVFVGVVGGLFLINRWATGEFNYQGGHRVTCLFRFPLEDSRVGIDDCFSMATEKLADTATPKEWLTGWRSYLVGRFGGVAWHFPMAIVALAAFLRRPRDPWRWGLIVVAIAEIGWALYFIPFNYVGGGGAIGNRYFMGTYALLFFLLARPLTARTLALGWGAVGLLLGGALLAPTAVTASPGSHAMSAPWRWFAPDRELLLDLPTDTNPHAYGKPFGTPPRYKLYFLDDSFYGPETGCGWVPSEHARGAGCFWIRGGRTAEFLLQSEGPLGEILVAVANGPRPNHVVVRVEGREQRVELAPGEVRVVSLPAGEGFSYHHKGLDVLVHRVSVASERGFVPALDSGDGRSGDQRYLGVFLNVDVVPRQGGPGT